ncbi:hypothetical protein ACIRL0_09765 [Streptomyces sp. NPDC102365]|uniref:hypothetical protein n=1 Tax=Streptomyces sp. NPDC102365 TaxID=3366162 RepID=UPI00380A09C4
MAQDPVIVSGLGMHRKVQAGLLVLLADRAEFGAWLVFGQLGRQSRVRPVRGSAPGTPRART